LRYYFNIRDQHGFVIDEEGSELPDMEAALREAHASARDFVMDAMRGCHPLNGRRIEISDCEGNVLDSMAVRDIVN
jgi:hypothetical protein